ncbi:hypothetical protein ABIE44_001674 [Marmoricola sp. OAE513]|uniref:hypothetical protein n=1 Tax=Marmoricola sp. OAE513 TaxID=2817894 RepID=UPI001AE7C7F8
MNTTSTLLASGLATIALVALSACGSNSPEKATDPAADQPAASSSSSTTSTTSDPCSITTAATIQAITGGSVAEGVPGNARDCTYEVSGANVRTIAVFAYGSAAEFDGIKSGYATNRGGTEDVPGVGNRAFSPVDVGQNEVVAEAGGTVFAVSTLALSADEIDPEAKAVAAAIATDLA